MKKQAYLLSNLSWKLYTSAVDSFYYHLAVKQISFHPTGSLHKQKLCM